MHRPEIRRDRCRCSTSQYAAGRTGRPPCTRDRESDVTGAEITRPSAREVVFSRLIAAPVALVWEIWSNVRHLHEWFGPAGFTTTTQEFAFTPGGVWRFT